MNPGFESGSLSPWFQRNDFSDGGGFDWTITTSDVHSGTYAAIDEGDRELAQTIASVATSQVTDVSFWMEHPNGSDASAYVELLYQDGSANSESSSSTGWQFFDVTSLLTPGETLTGLGIYGYNGGGDPITKLDDLSITANVSSVPEASTWAMLLVGFVGLVFAGCLRRRRSFAVSA